MVAILSYPLRTLCTAGSIGRILLAAAMLAAVSLAPAARAQLKAGVGTVSELDAVLVLVSFDRGSRTAVLQGAGGIDLSFTVPPDVQVFERIRPGELFSMRYTLLRTHELNTSGVAGVSEAQAREFDSADGRLVGRLTTTKRISLRVQAVNQAAKTLHLRDANDIAVAVAVDNEQGFGHVMAGDTITIISIESVELQILLP